MSKYKGPSFLKYMESTYKPVSRPEAVDIGQSFYIGKPCKMGHKWRYVTNSSCVLCEKNRGKQKQHQKLIGVEKIKNANIRREIERRREIKELEELEGGGLTR